MATDVSPILSSNDVLHKLQQLDIRREHIDVRAMRLGVILSAEKERLVLTSRDAADVESTFDEFPEARVLRSMGLSSKFLAACRDSASVAEDAVAAAARSMATDSKRMFVTRIGGRIAGVSPETDYDTPAIVTDVWSAVAEHSDILGAEIAPIRNGGIDLRVVSRIEHQPQRRVGDITRAGIRISIGNQISLNPFAFRLACLNGMQTMEEGRVFVLGVSDPAGDIRSIIPNMLEMSSKFADQFVRTDEQTVENPVDYVLRAFRIAGANPKTVVNIQERVREEAPNATLYELLNILTALARTKADKPSTRNRLEVVAGRVLEMQASPVRCRACGTAGV